jgi:hypothetical protein
VEEELMKEILVAAMLLALWASLMITDVRAYPYSQKEDAFSARIPSQAMLPK